MGGGGGGERGGGGTKWACARDKHFPGWRRRIVARQLDWFAPSASQRPKTHSYDGTVSSSFVAFLSSRRSPVCLISLATLQGLGGSKSKRSLAFAALISDHARSRQASRSAEEGDDHVEGEVAKRNLVHQLKLLLNLLQS